MRDEHITDILDGRAPDALKREELERVREHTQRCAECLRAYRASLASAALLKEHAAREFEPPPFFETRVLAALRERQTAVQFWSLRRLWNAAGALVASMALTVAALAALTLAAPDAPSETAFASDTYAEELAFTQEADEDLSDDQVLSNIYEAGEDAAQ